MPDIHPDLEAGKYANSPMFLEGVALLEELHPGVKGHMLEAAQYQDFRAFWRDLATTMFNHGTVQAGGDTFNDMVKSSVQKLTKGTNG